MAFSSSSTGPDVLELDGSSRLQIIDNENCPNSGAERPAEAIPVVMEPLDDGAVVASSQGHAQSSSRSPKVENCSEQNRVVSDATTLKPTPLFPNPPHLSTHESKSSSSYCTIFQRNKRCIFALLAIAILAAIIAVIVVATRKKHDDSDPPVNVNFSTGISVITQYAVNAKVRSRLATTTLTMSVRNGLNCSSIHMVTLQLPLNTRVTSLKTFSDDGCTTEGRVKEIEAARETFLEQSSQGLPSAYVEVQNSFTYSLQVSIPPMGETDVELIVEQLLQQRLGEVAFEIPMIPNEEVDKVKFDLSVEDVFGNLLDFDIDLDLEDLEESNVEADVKGNSTNTTFPKPINLHITDARQHNLPQVIRGRFKPNEVPRDGYLYTDGSCFEHFFLPTSIDPMPRNFFFLLDTSESMKYSNKLDNAKKALINFIDSLSPRDSLTIQTFAGKGTIDLWGVRPGTEEEKKDAKVFISKIKVVDDYRIWGTDLHEALLEALIRAQYDGEETQNDTVNVLVLISDAWASAGETDRAKIAKHVYDLNKDGSVKIFTLGFQGQADMTLLDAIALMNGGISAPILQGNEDFASQITLFLESELGTILLSDVTVKITGEDVTVMGETKKMYPLLAEGYEVVIRGLIGLPHARDANAPIKAITTAATMDNIQNWEVSTVVDLDDPVKSSLCFQSYAHSRISQLVRMREAAEFLGDDIVKSLLNLADSNCKEEEFSDCIKAEALDLAIEANVVAKGLTAMVTVNDDQCMDTDEAAEICVDGTTPDGNKESYEPKYGESTDGIMQSSTMTYGYADEYGYTSASIEISCSTLFFVLTMLSMLLFAIA
mmetsp:Transcript_17403/g.36455  ORF Transcript_17403/g.36455 Transcript_17403/m.36455 type:complete len:828 (+) Transcript_17403:125-2608(+)|eukprot:CAMPEP_0171338404 /NCGR_PEP_ID=MMETSP0878-20121228/7305_1 /TAXON_ID=67004 /ORGANISM="Thalassiosira weissflogii, Strain CCMP1336" /LENGTH=827 /DNA_ID=CAMNT_0011840181 /DNA_START=136 /DNA_END=2619 /DNA_ORIENTATION=-